jgi:hypothetical protein
VLPPPPKVSCDTQYDDTIYSLFLLLWQRWNAEMYSVVDFFANPREPSSCGFLGGFYTTSLGQFGGIFGSMVYTKTLRSSWTQSAGMAAQSGPKWARPIGLSSSFSYPSSSRRRLSMTLIHVSIDLIQKLLFMLYYLTNCNILQNITHM